MNITKPEVREDPTAGYATLNLILDGHPAHVFEPNGTLLDAGIVVLLDDTGHWHGTLSEVYGDEHGNCVSLPGATRMRRDWSGVVWVE